MLCLADKVGLLVFVAGVSDGSFGMGRRRWSRRRLEACVCEACGGRGWWQKLAGTCAWPSSMRHKGRPAVASHTCGPCSCEPCRARHSSTRSLDTDDVVSAILVVVGPKSCVLVDRATWSETIVR